MCEIARFLKDKCVVYPLESGVKKMLRVHVECDHCQEEVFILVESEEVSISYCPCCGQPVGEEAPEGADNE